MAANPKKKKMTDAQVRAAFDELHRKDERRKEGIATTVEGWFFRIVRKRFQTLPATYARQVASGLAHDVTKNIPASEANNPVVVRAHILKSMHFRVQRPERIGFLAEERDTAMEEAFLKFKATPPRGKNQVMAIPRILPRYEDIQPITRGELHQALRRAGAQTRRMLHQRRRP